MDAVPQEPWDAAVYACDDLRAAAGRWRAQEYPRPSACDAATEYGLYSRHHQEMADAVALADAMVARLAPADELDDEVFGRAWAGQQGKSPHRHATMWYWMRGYSTLDDPKATLHLWVFGLLPGAEASDTYLAYATEFDAYAALGRAVRAVHAAVPPLTSSATSPGR